MAPVHSLPPRSENEDEMYLSSSTTALMFCWATVITLVPVTVAVFVRLRDRIRHQRNAAQSTRNEGLKPFQLQRKLDQSRKGESSTNEAMTIPARSSSARPRDQRNTAAGQHQSERQRMAARLSRPVYLPIRLSTLQPRPPDSMSKPAKPGVMSVSRTSLVSPASSTYTNNMNTTTSSPVSPHSVGPLTVPAAIYFPSRQDRCDAYRQNPSRNPRTVNTNVECSRALEDVPNPSTAEMSSGTVKAGRVRRNHKYEDAEWKETRTETVDGILAPREWV